MKIKSVSIRHFKRFAHLEIEGLLETAHAVVLAGPNGSGKTSLFDALHEFHGRLHWGTVNDPAYYNRSSGGGDDTKRDVKVEFYSPVPRDAAGKKKLFYFRTAYRNVPELVASGLQPKGDPTDRRVRRMIENDASVSDNYHRLVLEAVESMFTAANRGMTVGEFTDGITRDVKASLLRLFPDLELSDLGNPNTKGTFRFNKGSESNFDYKNLSGGEKAAFDLILDLALARRTFDDSIFCIDEPEAHLAARIQAGLFSELYDMVPENSQLWIATHSIGMMERARSIYRDNPGRVLFLDFANCDFDKPVVLGPVTPSRRFWQGALQAAIDDLAQLVVPETVIVCEGNPLSPVPAKNAAHDADCYNKIFNEEFADALFISAGSSSAVVADRLALVATLAELATGLKVRKLIDRDDHAPSDVAKLSSEGVEVLGRRTLESYLYDDEVLESLCDSVGKSHLKATVLVEKAAAVSRSVARGNPPDDLKSPSGEIYNMLKRQLGLTAVGNDALAFARNTLAPLLKPPLNVYTLLRNDIFEI